MDDSQIEIYTDKTGKSPFERWFRKLNSEAAAEITFAVKRIELGTAQFKTVGKGVQEVRVDFGPGYRIYVGRRGDKLVVLLGGGTKSSKSKQNLDIQAAHKAWADYKQQLKE